MACTYCLNFKTAMNAIFFVYLGIAACILVMIKTKRYMGLATIQMGMVIITKVHDANVIFNVLKVSHSYQLPVCSHAMS